VAEVLVDVNVGLPRCGCAPEDAARVAELARSRGLEVRGVMGYEGHLMMVEDREARSRGVEESMAKLARAHREVGGEIVSAGGTGSYDSNQLATEIQASGRQVTLAVGEHVRLPRMYRGKDIQHWMHVTGVLDEKYDVVDDIRRARGVSSPQLVGTSDRRTLDLNALSGAGVLLAGRLAGVRDGKLQFSGSLRNVCKLADLKMNRLLDAIDDWIAEQGVGDGIDPSKRFDPTRVPDSPCLGFDLAGGEIRTVVWATGYRPDYSWLEVPILDHKGQIRHDGGVVEAPGMYVLGLPYLRRRKSSFIHGAEDDARDLCEHIVAYLDATSTTSRIRMAV